MSLKYRDDDPRIAAGDIRHVIAIQRNTATTADAAGALNPQWVKLKDTYAAIEPLMDKELLIGKQVNAAATHKITMRYFAGLTCADRIVFQQRLFDINNINNVQERNTKYVLICQELS